VITVAKLGVDLDVFKTLAEDDGKECSVADLAQKTGAEESLLRKSAHSRTAHVRSMVILTVSQVRVLRGLAAHGLISETGKRTFFSNEATKFFAQVSIVDSVNHNFVNIGPMLQALPKYLSAHGYRNPTEAPSAFNDAFHTDQPLFEWFGEHPENLKAATGTMAAQRVGQPDWFAEDDLFTPEYFHLSEDDVSRGRALLVDVGGGGGQQSIAFRNARPQLPGRTVLQDLPSTIASFDAARVQTLDELKIECQGYDFFTPQIEVGAKVYHLRNVLHDWPDDKCLTILATVRKAMNPDSVLIIDEIVVDEKSNYKQFNYDIIMMAALCAMERTESQWRELFEASGLQLKEIRAYDEGNGDSVIFAVPV
jgi:demethylsterigmatocystin 6-O-methyltransferase